LQLLQGIGEKLSICTKSVCQSSASLIRAWPLPVITVSYTVFGFDMNQRSIAEQEEYTCLVDVYDPWINVKEAQHEYSITQDTEPYLSSYTAVILDLAYYRLLKGFTLLHYERLAG
jgi:hypothetical protein